MNPDQPQHAELLGKASTASPDRSFDEASGHQCDKARVIISETRFVMLDDLDIFPALRAILQ